MQSIKPHNNYVLGTVVKTGPQSKAGLFLPDSSQKKAALTDVVAVGPDVQKVKVGSRVIFKEYTQHEVKMDGTEFVMVEEPDILGEVVEAKE